MYIAIDWYEKAEKSQIRCYYVKAIAFYSVILRIEMISFNIYICVVKPSIKIVDQITILVGYKVASLPVHKRHIC